MASTRLQRGHADPRHRTCVFVLLPWRVTAPFSIVALTAPLSYRATANCPLD